MLKFLELLQLAQLPSVARSLMTSQNTMSFGQKSLDEQRFGVGEGARGGDDAEVPGVAAVAAAAERGAIADDEPNTMSFGQKSSDEQRSASGNAATGGDNAEGPGVAAVGAVAERGAISDDEPNTISFGQKS